MFPTPKPRLSGPKWSLNKHSITIKLVVKYYMKASWLTQAYRYGIEEALKSVGVEPLKRSLLLQIKCFSALGLLPALLLEFDKYPNAVLCKTPVGDDSTRRGLPSHPAVIRFSPAVAEEDGGNLLFRPELWPLVLCRASPRGPPTELASHSLELEPQLGSLMTLVGFPSPRPI